MPKKPKTFFEQELDRIAVESQLSKHHYIHIRQARAYMENNFSGNVSLDNLATEAFMSPSHFIRIFQNVYGMTPRQFLRDLRIKKAKKLLKGGAPVTEVCFEVGYSSLPTFSKTFKAGTGLSPKKYQELNKSNLG